MIGQFVDNNRFKRGGLITGDYHFHDDTHIEFDAGASLRPKQFVEGEPVQITFREAEKEVDGEGTGEYEYRTEIDGDLKVNG